MRARSASVRRSAASMLIWMSSAARTSRKSASTARSTRPGLGASMARSTSGLIDAIGSSTSVPRRRTGRTRRCTSRSLMASRMTERLTECCSASSASFGSSEPTSSSPATMRRRRSCATRSALRSAGRAPSSSTTGAVISRTYSVSTGFWILDRIIRRGAHAGRSGWRARRGRDRRARHRPTGEAARASTRR